MSPGYSNVSENQMEDAENLQREFEKVMSNTSNLPEDQQDQIMTRYIQLAKNTTWLMEEGVRQRQANRQSTGRSVNSSSGFEGRYELSCINYKYRSQIAFFRAARKSA